MLIGVFATLTGAVLMVAVGVDGTDMAGGTVSVLLSVCDEWSVIGLVCFRSFSIFSLSAAI